MITTSIRSYTFPRGAYAATPLADDRATQTFWQWTYYSYAMMLITSAGVLQHASSVSTVGFIVALWLMVSLCAHQECAHVEKHVRVPAYRVVIVHDDHGVFVGEALGLSFWTCLYRAEQPSCASFVDEAHARDHVHAWNAPHRHESYHYVHVVISRGTYARRDDLLRAGVPKRLLGDMPA